MAGRRVERFLTTVLFTDIVGSTELAAELGDRGWRDLLQEHHQLTRRALRKYGGREVDTAGDSFFAVFDAPASAVECALEVIEAVRSIGLDVRAGLHVGEVEQIAGKVGGLSVPIGSRIMSVAGAGEVLVSSTVRDLAAGAGLRFTDRGVHSLKGVPGEWHLYGVSRASEARAAAGEVQSATSSEGDQPSTADVMSGRAARRAAAVRRSQARPIWQRRPRLTAAVVVLLVGAVAGAGLLAWSPWLPRALPGVDEDSLGVIDPVRNVIIGTARVGSQPSAIAFGEGYVWIANEGDNTVSVVDPQSQVVIDTIDVGAQPVDLVVGAGSLWVANSAERSVTRINIATRRIVDTVIVGNGPRALAFGAGAVWVANASDGTVTRIDSESGVAGTPLAVGSSPSAIAGDDAGVWVTSEDAGAVTHLDANSGTALAAPVAVGTRPDAVALGDTDVFVANSADGSVSRIDKATNRVTGVIDVGGSPIDLASAGTTLWVADSSGAIERVDVSNASGAPTKISAGSSPQTLGVVGSNIWFASRSATSSHRGGSIHVVSVDAQSIDPSAWPNAEFADLIGDGLVGYRHVGGIAGAQLVPDLAASMPTVADGGLTYTFHLRTDIKYSDGSTVSPSDVKFSLERTFQVPEPFSGAPLGPDWFGALDGAEKCTSADTLCDLSSAIVIDDAANTVAIHLATPDPDFLFKLAVPFAHIVRAGSVPAMTEVAVPYPVLGPYQIASTNGTETTLQRNPEFHSWDAQVRPEAYADEIVWTSGVDAIDQVEMVRNGTADYMATQIPAEAFADLRTQLTPQLHIASTSTTYLFLNTALPPFDNLQVRRAVNLAVDRHHVVELRGGDVAARPTCQMLPRNFPGYVPYCPYTKDPTVDGVWTAPDVDAARALVVGSGTAGMKVVVGPLPPRLTPISEYIATVLRDLGYDASFEVAASGEQVFKAIFEDRRVQVGGFEFGPDFPSPGTFLDHMDCDPGDGQSNYCDPQLDALVKEAIRLEQTDPAAGDAKWAEVDHMVTDLALRVPLVNEGSDFVSGRVRNYEFNPALNILLDQLWVQ